MKSAVPTLSERMKCVCQNKPNDSDSTVETNNAGQREQALKVIECFGCDECENLVFNTGQSTAQCSWSKKKIRTKLRNLNTVPHWTLSCDVYLVAKGLLEWENFAHHYIWDEWDSDWDEKLHNQKHGQCEVIVVPNRILNRMDALWSHAIWRPTSGKEYPTVDAWNRNLVFSIAHFSMKKSLALSIFAKKEPLSLIAIRYSVSSTHSVRSSKWSFRPWKWDKFFVFRAFESWKR